MKMIELTEEELNLILERRKKQEEEEYRQARVQAGIAEILEGYNLIIKNGGTVSLVGGGYIRTEAFVTGIRETKKGIQFEHKIK